MVIGSWHIFRAKCACITSRFCRAKRRGALARWRNEVERANESATAHENRPNESSRFGQKNLQELQGGAPPRRGADFVLQSTPQAAPRLAGGKFDGTYSGCRTAA